MTQDERELVAEELYQAWYRGWRACEAGGKPDEAYAKSATARLVKDMRKDPAIPSDVRTR